MTASVISDWFPGGSRAEPLRESEGRTLTSEAKPNEQNEPRLRRQSGEFV